MVATDVIAPLGSPPLFGVADRGVFVMSAGVTTFPSRYYITNNNFGYGWAFGFTATVPSFVCVIKNFAGIGTPDSGCSSDGGLTWSLFADQSPGSSSKNGGSIAVADTNHIVWVPGNAQTPFCTSNGGTSWVVCPGLPGASDGWVYSFVDGILQGNYEIDKYILVCFILACVLAIFF